ncbi:hypothetical protein SteCoe_25294 [Stentor coeruleus]|uniref:Uncharacterized protein n=1 Tax=Stentor coeruleus TaxID=5963 RepID=A0A1R2BFR1_9CILI|nr:hypothetical protein SteCoe_25294 [Stentor coeruleus]
MFTFSSHHSSPRTIEQLLSSKAYEISHRKKASSSEPASCSNARVEAVLLLKHARSQAKITALRVKKQANETKSLRPAPKINKVSKQIIEIKEGKWDSTLNSYANSIVAGTKSSKCFIMHPKHSFLSLADLEVQENKDVSEQNSCFHIKKHSEGTFSQESLVNLLKTKDPNSKAHESRITLSFTQENFNLQTKDLSESHKFIKKSSQKLIKSSSGNTNRINSVKSNPESSLKINKAKEELSNIRKALFAKQQKKEVEEKKDILNMTVQQRNEYWLNKKNTKINKEQEKKKEEEIKMCTFSPKIVPRIDISKDSRNIKPTSFYSTKYSEQMNLTINKNKNCLNSNKHKKKKVLIYKALSPHRQQITKALSEDIFKKKNFLVGFKS